MSIVRGHCTKILIYFLMLSLHQDNATRTFVRWEVPEVTHLPLAIISALQLDTPMMIGVRLTFAGKSHFEANYLAINSYG